MHRHSWNKRIDAELGKGRKNATVKGIGNVDAAIKKFEKVVNAPLHLFWAFPQNWDKKTTPIVAFMPLDKAPKTCTSVPAFDSKGNRLDLNQDGSLAKQRPVIVLTYNERTTLTGETKNQLIPGNAKSQKTGSQEVTTLYKSKSGNQSEQIANTGYAPYVTLVSVTFAGVTDNVLWWEGQPEFEYQASVRTYHPYYYTTSEYSFGGRTRITGEDAGNGAYSVGHTFTMGNQPNSPVQSTHGLFTFYEDDGWDMFDWHFSTLTVVLGPGTYPYPTSGSYIPTAMFQVSN